MGSQFSLPASDRTLIAALLLLFLLTRLPLLAYLPFVKDEGLYAVMIEEQRASPTFVPTFLGEPVNWKPPVFFWAYSLFPQIPLLPMEASYRLPSMLFGLLAVPIVFDILRNTGAGRNVAFFSTLIFIASMPSMYPNAALLIDSLLFLLLCAALWLYIVPKCGGWRFIAAGTLVFAAFFVKLILAALPPLLAAAFFALNDRRQLRNPLFLLSLAALPAAFLLNSAILQSCGFAGGLSDSAIGEHNAFHSLSTQLQYLMGSLNLFLIGAGVWFGLSLFGFARHWRAHPFMAFWYSLTAFPLIAGNFMIWYYLPVMPAIAFFAAMVLIRWGGQDNMDLFFRIFFAMALIASLGMIAFVYANLHEWYLPEKAAGQFLSGKDGVMMLGGFAPSTVAYKALGEMDGGGRALDFGWIVLNDLDTVPQAMEAYLVDYHSAEFDTESSPSRMFNTPLIFRKQTNLTSFERIVLVRVIPKELPPGTPAFNESDILIYGNGG